MNAFFLVLGIPALFASGYLMAHWAAVWLDEGRRNSSGAPKKQTQRYEFDSSAWTGL